VTGLDIGASSIAGVTGSGHLASGELPGLNS
jgi:hypothetical protein